LAVADGVVKDDGPFTVPHIVIFGASGDLAPRKYSRRTISDGIPRDRLSKPPEGLFQRVARTLAKAEALKNARSI
jgi:hypothetical protein